MKKSHKFDDLGTNTCTVCGKNLKKRFEDRGDRLCYRCYRDVRAKRQDEKGYV